MKLMTEHQATSYVGDPDYLLFFRKRGLKVKCRALKKNFYHQDEIDMVAWQWIFDMPLRKIMTVLTAEGNPRSIAVSMNLPLLVVTQIRTTPEIGVALPEIFRKKIASLRNDG